MLFDGLTQAATTLDKPISDAPRQGTNSIGQLFDGPNASAEGTPLSKVYAGDEVDKTQTQMEMLSALYPIQALINSRYENARYARKPVEQTWLENMLQWRGEFSPDEADSIRRAKQRNVYAAEVFIKITKTKVTAALGQILDLILDNDEIPIRIEPAAHQDDDSLPNVGFIAPEDYPELDPYGYVGDGKQVTQGATTRSMWGSAYDRLQKFMADKKLVREAGNPDPSKNPTVTPAADAADKMEKIILSQLDEGGFKREVRSAAWEMCVLGTGILKGPMTYKTVEHVWEKGDPDPDTGKCKINYVPKTKLMPKAYYVSAWNFFPDPAATRIENAQWTIEKHLLNSSGMADLKRIEGFDEKTIDRVIAQGVPTRSSEYWEDQIRDTPSTAIDNRWEVIEYWGYLEKDLVNTYRAATGEDLVEGQDQFHVNIWLCKNEILRLVINPFVPQRIPYYAIPYEEHTQQIWGIAIPENMRDAQLLMNNHCRMWIDNLALSGHAVFEVNENYLSPGQDLTIYPGKIIRTNNGAPGQSLFSLSFNNTSQSHMAAYDKARQIADEVTGQPSYANGANGSGTGANKTAAGMSMLMGAAASNIRQVVKQCDEYLFRPLGQACYNWNMQNNEDAVVEGKVEITAGGTAALMRREVMSQRLLQFAQAVGQNPAIAPRVNWNQWVKDFAKSMQLDPDKYLNDANAAMLAAQQMAVANGGGGQAQQPQGSAPGQAGAAQDQTGGGGGQIGAGMPTTPGESSSSQNVSQA